METNPLSVTLVDLAGQVHRDFIVADQRIRDSLTPANVEALRLEYMGRKGRVTTLLEGMGSVPKEQRPAAGKAVNELRSFVDGKLAGLKVAAQAQALQAKLQAPLLDITLPVDHAHEGSLHPVTLMRRFVLKEFARLGFTVYDGPEIDFDFYNFGALNFPAHHPARDMQDTFFIKSGYDAPAQGKLLLRTHTSNTQIHAMLAEEPPLRIVAPGRTFRCDSDMTHTPMFHQIEGFVVDRNISFAHLKGTVNYFLKAIFGKNVTTRFRPSFFPFVEPGAEVDMQCVACKGKGCRICKQSGFLEIGGCGMIHPSVFEAVGYDSEIFTGFAFGFGLDRMAMLKYDLPDLRQLFEGSRQFLGQFPILPTMFAVSDPR